MNLGIKSLLEDFCSSVRTVKFWKEFVLMTFSMMLAAVSVYYFLLPSKLVLGALSGLAIVISEVFSNMGVALKVSSVILYANIILLVVAWLTLGKEFGAKTVYCALIHGPLMDVCEKVMPYQQLLEPGQTTIMGDIWFDLLCFVLILSISQALLFNINASTGGLDIVAKLMQVVGHMEIGTAVTVAGGVICCTALVIHPIRMILIGLIGTWINGVAIDYFTASINRRKRVCIISPQCERIRRYIIEELVRGCSLYEVTGGYTGEKQTELQALLTKDEYAKVLEFVKENKIASFITGSNVSEVYGLWLSHDNGHKFIRRKNR